VPKVVASPSYFTFEVERSTPARSSLGGGWFDVQSLHLPLPQPQLKTNIQYPGKQKHKTKKPNVQ